MKKRLLLPIFLLVVIAFIWGLVELGPDFSRPDVSDFSNSTEDTKDEIPVAPRVYSEETEDYSIEVHYPEGEDPTVVAYMDSAVTSFKMNAGVGGIEQNYKSDLTINYEIQESKNIKTYIVTTYIYTGGAHGFEDIRTFSYDTNGNTITLDMLFSKDGYVPALSEVVKNKLENLLGDKSDIDTIESGAGQTKENFEKFYTTDNSIFFIFPPYAVAPYSIGLVKVEVPISTLGGMIDIKYFSI